MSKIKPKINQQIYFNFAGESLLMEVHVSINGVFNPPVQFPLNQFTILPKNDWQFPFVVKNMVGQEVWLTYEAFDQFLEKVRRGAAAGMYSECKEVEEQVQLQLPERLEEINQPQPKQQPQ